MEMQMVPTAIRLQSSKEFVIIEVMNFFRDSKLELVAARLRRLWKTRAIGAKIPV